MADLVVVDTDLVIYFLHGRGPGVSVDRGLLRQQRLRLTAVSAFELRVGTDLIARRDDILRLIRGRTTRSTRWLAVRAAEVASELRAAGQQMAFADCLVAGVCLRHDLPLATMDRRHFQRVEGLRLMSLEAASG